MSEKYNIAHDIPPPEPVTSGEGDKGRPTKYPWIDMDVGASFWKECAANQTPDQVSNGLTSAARNWSRNNMPGSKFTSRQEGNGARVWRIQ